MQFKTLAVLAGAALVSAQGVTENISPEGGIPSGCEATYPGRFEITLYNVTNGPSKRDLEARQGRCSGEGALVLTLNDGVLLDSLDRTGYIADNRQFQFDKPAQTGAIYTAGWSVCQNTSLALGPSTVFYRCLSGDFYNLYDQDWAEQCEMVAIGAVPCDGQAPQPVAPSGVNTAPAAGQSPDGQPTGTGVNTPVTQIGDGQIQAPSVIPSVYVSQIGDGQIQVPTASMPAPAVTQIGDGQIQAPTGPAISQIGDGQIQAPNATAPVAPSPSIVTGSAGAITASGLLAAVGVFAAALL